jgi:peptide/nickel transport system ATP-binding protein
MIAMAIACKPQLIADEPTTALDVTVQKEIIQLLKDIQQETGMSIIFISHDLSLVSAIAHRVVVMYQGG